VGPAGAGHRAVHGEGHPLKPMDVEEANVVQGYVLSPLEDGVVSASVDYEMEVLVPVAEDCRAVHYARAWRPT